jgi:hypothetical protein
MKKNPTDTNVVAPLIPELKTNDDVEAFSVNFTQFGRLSNKHLAILIAIGQDLVSETPRSDVQIAEKLGIDRKTVAYARNTPDFASAMGIMVTGIARGKSDLYLRWTEKAAQDGKVGALKLLWQIAGLLIERKKNMNLNMDMEFSASEQPKSYLDVVDEFIIALGEAGWSGQMIVDRYEELRASGAW